MSVDKPDVLPLDIDRKLSDERIFSIGAYIVDCGIQKGEPLTGTEINKELFGVPSTLLSREQQAYKNMVGRRLSVMVGAFRSYVPPEMLLQVIQDRQKKLQ